MRVSFLSIISGSFIGTKCRRQWNNWADLRRSRIARHLCDRCFGANIDYILKDGVRKARSIKLEEIGKRKAVSLDNKSIPF